MKEVDKMKYYGTTTNGFIIPEELKKKYNLEGAHEQYRLVIKAKSRAAANRRWREVTGRNSDIFFPNYTSETGNKLEIELADTYGEIINKHNSDYVDLKVLVKEIAEIKNR